MTWMTQMTKDEVLKMLNADPNVYRQFLDLSPSMKTELIEFSMGVRGAKITYDPFCIIIMQKSPEVFHQYPNDYLHYSRQTFNTGLNYDMLQEYVLIPLDIFLKIPHNKLSQLDAWLYLIASDRLEDIRKVTASYPEFKKIYQEVFHFRYHAKELVGMFSEALKILDANTTQYMIEEQQKKIEAQQNEINRQKIILEEKEREIEELRSRLKEEN